MSHIFNSTVPMDTFENLGGRLEDNFVFFLGHQISLFYEAILGPVVGQKTIKFSANLYLFLYREPY
jgi:hypothetical protein